MSCMLLLLLRVVACRCVSLSSCVNRASCASCGRGLVVNSTKQIGVIWCHKNIYYLNLTYIIAVCCCQFKHVILTHSSFFIRFLLPRLTTEDGNHFRSIKSVISVAVVLPWSTADVERLGSKVGAILENGPSTGVHTLYDKLVIMLNVPHWLHIDYNYLAEQWLENKHKNAVLLNEKLESKVLVRKQKNADEKNWCPFLRVSESESDNEGIGGRTA